MALIAEYHQSYIYLRLLRNGSRETPQHVGSVSTPEVTPFRNLAMKLIPNPRAAVADEDPDASQLLLIEIAQFAFAETGIASELEGL